MEKQLADTLQRNSQTVIQANNSIAETLEPLQIAASPDHEEMVNIFEENLSQSISVLGQDPEQLKSRIHEETVRTINRFSQTFADEKRTTPDKAVIQAQLEAEFRGSLRQFADQQLRNQTPEQSKKISDIGLSLDQTTYDYLRSQPSLNSRFQTIGGLTTFQALLTDPKLIPGFTVSLLFSDSKFQKSRLRRLAEKTGLDIFTLKAALAGYTPQAVGNLVAGLQGGQSLFGRWQVKEGILSTDPRILKLNQLALNLGKVEDIIKNPHGFNQRLFSFQARLNQTRYKLFETAGKINPLRPMFYAYDFLQPETLTGIQQVINPIPDYENYFREKLFGRFIARRYKTRVAWSNFLKSHSKLNRFVNFLPKLKISYWGKALIRGAAKKAGSWLLTHASKGLFKALGTKLLGWGVAAVAGAATGGVATALAVVGGVLQTAAVIIFSKEGREIIKKVGTAVAAGVTALLQFAFQLLAQFKFTILGTFIGGSILGLPGATAGFFIGRILDKGVIPFFQNIGGSLAGASGAGLGGTTAAATAGIAGAGAATTGLAALSPAMAVPVSIGLVGFLSYNYFVNINSSFVLPANLGPGPEIAEYSQDENLSVNKSADPITVAGTGNTISYTIEVSTQDGGLTNVIITDDFDENSLEVHSFNYSPTSRNETLIWDIDQMVKNGDLSGDFSQPGDILRLTYKATTKSTVNSNSRIRNEVVVTSQKQEETITRKDYVVINSACNDVVATAQEIMQDLVKGNSSECITKNSKCNQDATSRGYQTLFNCPVSDEWKDETGHGCIYCNNLVTIAYVKSGRPNPIGGFQATAAKWEQEGILTVKNGKGDINDVSEGDVIFFDVGSTPFRHTGLVCNVYPAEGRVCACEANNWTIDLGKLCYSWSNGSFIPLGTRIKVAINAIGDTCQE